MRMRIRSEEEEDWKGEGRHMKEIRKERKGIKAFRALMWEEKRQLISSDPLFYRLSPRPSILNRTSLPHSLSSTLLSDVFLFLLSAFCFVLLPFSVVCTFIHLLFLCLFLGLFIRPVCFSFDSSLVISFFLPSYLSFSFCQTPLASFFSPSLLFPLLFFRLFILLSVFFFLVLFIFTVQFITF